MSLEERQLFDWPTATTLSAGDISATSGGSMCQTLKGFSLDKETATTTILQLLRRPIQLLKKRFCILIKQSFQNQFRGKGLCAVHIYYVEENAYLWYQQKTITTELMI